MKKTLTLLLSVICLLAIFTGTTNVKAAFDPFNDACGTIDNPNTSYDETSQKPTDSTLCNEKDKPASNPLTGKTGILVRATRFITFITGMASIVILLYAGLKYVTSDGDSNSVGSAKNTVLYAFIGLVLSLLSQAIIVFVINNVK